MIDGQSADTAVEWAKCFLCQNGPTESLLSPEKLCAIFKNMARFAAIDEVPSRLFMYEIDQERNYHPKHHKSCTANYGCNLLA